MKNSRLARILIGWPPAFYMTLFFLIPTLIMVVAAFRFPGDYGGLAPLLEEDGSLNLTLENFERVFEDPLYISLFLKSAWYALITTVVCLLMAYPLAWVIARSQKKYRDILLLLVILPFWSNFLIRIYAWMIILGPQSLLTQGLNQMLDWFGCQPVSLLFNSFAVIVGLVYVHLPFMVLPLYANLEKHDTSLLDAAQDLGASAWYRFWKITWPLSLPGVFAGAALVFIPALGMFAVPDILGGTDSIMIGNLIKQQILDTRDWPFGSVLSIMLTLGVLFISLLAMFVARGGWRRG
jgi:spermidine/putrescine transport system permease protein